MRREVTPEGWSRGQGYSHGIVAEGRLVFVAGQVGWDTDRRFRSNDFVDQLRQALENTLAVLQAAGASADQVVRMTWFLLDKQAYLTRLPDVGRVYREVMGRNFPAMSVVVVSDLIEDGALLEIETTAVLPRE